MSRYGLTRDNLIRALPVALQKDPSAVALAESVAELLSQRPGEIERVCIYPHIERLDAELLDILAHDCKVDWWDADDALEEKRRTLQSSWRVHKMLGTKYAVETALSAVFPGTKIEEWFEYGGKPHHFRIYSRQDGGAFSAASTTKKFLRTLEQLKRLSAWLDDIVFGMPVTVFTESPGNFIFRRLAIASTFVHYRGNRFNGARRFDGSILFDQDGVGIRFERVILSILCPHIIKDSTGMALPSLRISATLPRVEQTAALRFCATATATHHNTAALPRLTVNVNTRHSNAMTGNLTIDNMYTFDGSVSFDGTRRFAYIKKEEL